MKNMFFTSALSIAAMFTALTAFGADEAKAPPRPRLLDLGAHACIPCKMMAPILEELKKEYADRFETVFIDVWQKENAEKAKQYGIRSIPTQIFFDADGKELWRHEGFISKEDILKKWKELGYDFLDDGAEAKIERGEPAKKDDQPTRFKKSSKSENAVQNE